MTKNSIVTRDILDILGACSVGDRFIGMTVDSALAVANNRDSADFLFDKAIRICDLVEDITYSTIERLFTNDKDVTQEEFAEREFTMVPSALLEARFFARVWNKSSKYVNGTLTTYTDWVEIPEESADHYSMTYSDGEWSFFPVWKEFKDIAEKYSLEELETERLYFSARY